MNTGYKYSSYLEILDNANKYLKKTFSNFQKEYGNKPNIHYKDYKAYYMKIAEKLNSTPEISKYRELETEGTFNEIFPINVEKDGEEYEDFSVLSNNNLILTYFNKLKTNIEKKLLLSYFDCQQELNKIMYVLMFTDLDESDDTEYEVQKKFEIQFSDIEKKQLFLDSLRKNI